MLTKLHLERLLSAKKSNVLSVYLHVDPSQETKDSYRIWLKDALRDLERAQDHSEQKSFREVAEAVLARAEKLPQHGKSWIVFASKEGLDEFFPQVPVSNEAHWGLAQLTQLNWLLEEYRPYGVVQADSEHMRLFVLAMNEILEIDDQTLELDTSGWREKSLMPTSQPRGSVTHGSMRGGNLRDDFADREKTQTLRFWKEAAPLIKKMTGLYGVKDWVISGSKGVRDGFIKQAGLKDEAVAGQISTPLTASPSEVMDSSLPIVQAHERAREERLVEALLTRASKSERAGTGLQATLWALQEGRVETIVVNRRLEAVVSHCVSCSRLFDPAQVAAAKGSCPNCGSKTIKQESLRVMLPSAVQKHGAKIEVVRGEAARKLEPLDGIGAFWRY